MSDSSFTCVADLLFNGAKPDDRIAIVAPGYLPITYGNLRDQATRAVGELNAMGYGRNDRVAVAISRKPEMMVAMLSVCAGCTCIPMNPGYKGPEFEQYLSSTGARAVIVQAGEPSPAAGVARSLGVEVIELRPLHDGSALFCLSGAAKPGPAARGGFAKSDDIAMILQTSGTTARPKIVPITQGNLCHTALYVRDSGRLTADDRFLHMLPVYYAFGIAATLLCSLAAGGSVVCVPGFVAPEFPKWLEEYRPTWYSAAPAIHQKVLECVAGADKPLATSLRMIRSASAPLPDPVMRDLEQTFGVSVVETYGMTEASAIATTPLPPGPRKPGSVGVLSRCEAEIVDDAGNPVPAGRPGEIVVRGPGVIGGYENNPEENARAFVNGWFRTGDYGYLDPDGYLFIVGRIKEMINRGGEKVSPYEVEAVLMSHPDVRESVVFPVPDPSLGEQVAAAVVPREGAAASEESLRSYALNRLARFKVPAQILIVDAIPKSDNSKPQRLGMAKALGVSARPPQARPRPEYSAPSDEIEKQLAGILAGIFPGERIGVNDDFFDLGGDSATALQLFTEIERRFRMVLPLDTLFQCPTVSKLAHAIRGKRSRMISGSLLELKNGAAVPPLFCLHNLAGALFDYQVLARQMDGDRQIYGLLPPPGDGPVRPMENIGAMASYYIEVMKAVQPGGPYHLLGYCFGGAIAYEMARQLQAAGDEVGFLGLIEYVAPGYRYVLDVKSAAMLLSRGRLMIANILRAPRGEGFKLAFQAPLATGKFVAHSLRSAIAVPGPGKAPGGKGYPEWIACQPANCRDISMLNYRIAQEYYPGEYGGRGKITLFISQKTDGQCCDAIFYDRRMGWEKYVKPGVAVETVLLPGDHHTIMQRPNVVQLAAKIAECLEAIPAGPV